MHCWPRNQVFIVTLGLSWMIVGCNASRSPSPDRTRESNAHSQGNEDTTEPSQIGNGQRRESDTIEPVKASPDSIISLLANPKEWHGKEVHVEGFLVLDFEGTAIYLSKEHAVSGLTGNSLWVSFDEKAIPFDEKIGPTRYDRQYVFLHGIFNKNAHGHMRGWNGSIENIHRIGVLRGTDPPPPARALRSDQRQPDRVPEDWVDDL